MGIAKNQGTVHSHVQSKLNTRSNLGIYVSLSHRRTVCLGTVNSGLTKSIKPSRTVSDDKIFSINASSDKMSQILSLSRIKSPFSLHFLPVFLFEVNKENS